MSVFGYQPWRTGNRAIPGLPIQIPFPLYLDSEAADGGDGTEESPINSLTLAMALASGRENWLVKIRAPEQTPFRVQPAAFESTQPLTLDAWDAREPWHFYGSEQVTGWTDQGGGVWSAFAGFTIVSIATIMTLEERIGDRLFKVKITSEGETTTPSPGRLGYVNDVIYIRLPNDENPNLHDVEVARRNNTFRAYGYEPLTIKNFVARNFLNSAVGVGLSTNAVGTGKAILENGLIEYSGLNGITTAANNESTICTNVKAYRCTNDGFNMRRILGTGYMELNNCDGSYNGDEAGQSSQGCSNHSDSTMIVNGGRYNYNISGGMVSVNDCRIDIHGDTEHGPVVMDNNMRLGNEGASFSQGGCAWLNNTFGTVTGDVTVSNTQGVGVRVATEDNVAGVELIKSINNLLPDDF